MHIYDVDDSFDSLIKEESCYRGKKVVLTANMFKHYTTNLTSLKLESIIQIFFKYEVLLLSLFVTDVGGVKQE